MCVQSNHRGGPKKSYRGAIVPIEYIQIKVSREQSLAFTEFIITVCQEPREASGWYGTVSLTVLRKKVISGMRS